MGAFGYGPFDNDSAGDAVAEVRNSIEHKLRTWIRRHPAEDERAVAFVAMLIKLGEGPSSPEFGERVAKKIIKNFHAPAAMHTIHGKSHGKNGDTWNEPQKRLTVIRRTLRRWIRLGSHTAPNFLADGTIENPRKR